MTAVSSYDEAADALSAAREEVLARWEAALVDNEPAAKGLDRETIRDHLPQFLDCLCDALRAGSIDALHGEQERYARCHGRERAKLEEFDLEQLFVEWRLLRRTLLAVLEERTSVGQPVRNLVYEAVEEAITAAAAQYLRTQFARERESRELAERATRRLRGLQVVTEAALVSRISSHTLLEEVLDRVQHVFGCQTAAVLLVDEEDGRQLRTVAARGLDADVVQRQPVAVGRGLAGSVFAGRRPRIADAETLTELVSPTLRELKVESLMAAPLLIPDRALGVIQVGEKAADAYVEDDLRLLALIADRLAVAIEHARLYEQSLRSLELLREERNLRESFVIALMHDLRSPLSVVAMNLELISRRPDRPPSPSALSLARRNVRRIDRLTQDLLDVSRLRAGRRLPADVQDLDLLQLVREYAAEVCSVHGAGRCVVRASAERIEGRWDGEALRRILQNIVDNALKYGSEAEPVEIALETTERQVVLSVHNAGPAIPEEVQEQLFWPFERFVPPDGGGARKRGWGIGLALVRGLTESQGGSVAVRSAESQGTTFIVELPRDASPYIRER